jgi:hypothetical protein
MWCGDEGIWIWIEVVVRLNEKGGEDSRGI